MNDEELSKLVVLDQYPCEGRPVLEVDGVRACSGHKYRIDGSPPREYEPPPKIDYIIMDGVKIWLKGDEE